MFFEYDASLIASGILISIGLIWRYHTACKIEAYDSILDYDGTIPCIVNNPDKAFMSNEVKTTNILNPEICVIHTTLIVFQLHTIK
jgi:hypothetical protein